MSPERRRRTVDAVRRHLGHDKISQRRACKALGQPRSTQRYQARQSDMDRRLITEMRRLSEAYPRYGSPRVHKLLVGTGWRVNIKRVHRLWKREHLQVPERQRKRRRLPGDSQNGCIRYRATHRNHVWSYDFVMDRTEDGRQLKLLVVIDEYTRECLALEVGRWFTARDVMLTLQYLFAVRGAPEHVRSDNGPEFIARQLQRWLDQAAVGTLYIQKGSPGENGYVESFNGKLRDELLNGELFLNVPEVRYVLDEWRLDYNHHRPHSSLGWKTPAAFAATLNDPAAGVFPAASLADPSVGAAPLPTAQQANSYHPILSQ